MGSTTSSTSTSISSLGTNTGNFSVNPYVIPAIGSVGSYVLASPYNTLIDPNINYTCMAIRTIGELLADAGCNRRLPLTRLTCRQLYVSA